MSSPMDIVGIPASAIALFAHPDDPDFTSGGTIARWTAAGSRVTYVIMTDGRSGAAGLSAEENARTTPAELIAMRQAEQRAAAAELGVEDVVFFDYPDGELIHTVELRRQLVREIRVRKPEAAVLFDPQRRVMPGHVQHPDHWVSGEAALAAIYPLSGTRRAFPEMLDEGIEPHFVRDVYLVGGLQPNLRIDISDTMERKVAAMHHHYSQVADTERTAGFMRERAARTADGTTFTYAEAFQFLRMGERDLVLEY